MVAAFPKLKADVLFERPLSGAEAAPRLRYYNPSSSR
jgi:hypothetical protein